MKKIFAIVLTVLCIALSVTTVAFAQTDLEQKICELANQNEKVKDVKCIVYERSAIIALKTEKFGTKNEYDLFVKTLINQVKTECEAEHVFVTRNPKIMKQIEELSALNEEQRDAAIQKLIEELSHRRPMHKIDIPKITFDWN